MNGHELETNWLICDVLHFDIRQHGLSYGQFRRSFWVVGLRRSAICVNCVLEALLLLLTYLLTLARRDGLRQEKLMEDIRVKKPH